MKNSSNLLLRSVLSYLAVIVVSLGVLSSSPAHADNSCTFAFDNECDEPGIGTGLCSAGTDDSDCGMSSGPVGPNSCAFAFDGECDEPGIGTGACTSGTDRSDCSAPTPATGPNSCAFAFDGECDEPGIGTGACNAGTDRSDCSRPTTQITPARPTTVTPTRPAATRPGLQSTQQGTDTQNALNYFGFNAGRVDGQIGAGTRAAIERFQRATGYPVNGRNFPADQFGFLTGAYSWATGPLGAAQGAADGTTKLRNYRTFLLNGSVVPTPVAPVQAPATPPPPPLDPVWHIANSGESSGPFSRAIMGQKVAEGTVTRETMVWTAGQGEWKPANTVSALAELFTFVPPPPPPAD